MNCGFKITAVCDRDANQDVVGRFLCVFRENVEVTTAIKDTGIGKFVFEIKLSASSIFLDQRSVGVFCLWVFVE